jgi:hypothetical protein
MNIIRHLIQTFLLLLLTAFGAAQVYALSSDWQQVQCFSAYEQTAPKSADITFTARPPPLDRVNVKSTGTLFSGNGDARALDGAETHWASLNFSGEFIATNRVTNGLPDNPSQLGHIFGNRRGHLPDTPENRQLLVDTSNNPANSLGTNRFGNDVHVSTRPDGSQVWVETRNGIIQNGGVNNSPRTWVDGEGLR